MKRKRQSRSLKDTLDRMLRQSFRPPKKPKDKGGSEAVTVEPNRPKLNEGGAAAALEFDE
jgi:hypothetical protein